MASAISCVEPTFFIGFLFFAASVFSGELRKRSLNGDSVKDGATAFIRMVGAHSAASAKVSPSMAAFAMEMDE